MSVSKSPSKNSIALDLSTHNLNNSSSKQRFSFPKSSRFQNNKPLCDSFYQIPSTRVGRATSFGYGHKDMGLRLNKNLPEPASYNISSQFNSTSKKGNAFGPGRQEMALGGPLGEVMSRKYVPGPGNYKDYSTLQHPNNAVTIKSRLPDTSLNHLKKVPGPGAYGHQQFGTEKYYVISKHKNSTGAAKMTQRADRDRSLNKTINVGPGQYNVDQADMKPNGRYVLSNNRTTDSQVFPKSARESIVYKHLLSTPGPGSYTPFTYFGPA